VSHTILTLRFKAGDGHLYTIQWRKDGLEAYRPNITRESRTQPAAIKASQQALDEWIAKVAMLGE